jgi:hypothetical protein
MTLSGIEPAGLPACSIMPKPIMLLRAPCKRNVKLNLSVLIGITVSTLQKIKMGPHLDHHYHHHHHHHHTHSSDLSFQNFD